MPRAWTTSFQAFVIDRPRASTSASSGQDALGCSGTIRVAFSTAPRSRLAFSERPVISTATPRRPSSAATRAMSQAPAVSMWLIPERSKITGPFVLGGGPRGHAVERFGGVDHPGAARDKGASPRHRRHDRGSPLRMASVSAIGPKRPGKSFAGVLEHAAAAP
jgi:hypothetical protein